MTDAETIRGQFVASEDDHLVALREAAGPATSRWGWYVGLGLAVVAFGAFVGSADGWSNGPFWMLWGLLLAGAGFGTRGRTERFLRTYVRDRLELDRTIDVATTASHLILSVEPLLRTEMRLDALEAVEPREHGLLIALMKRESVWIPDRAFPSSSIRDRFHRRVLGAVGLPSVSL